MGAQEAQDGVSWRKLRKPCTIDCRSPVFSSSARKHCATSASSCMTSAQVRACATAAVARAQTQSEAHGDAGGAGLPLKVAFLCDEPGLIACQRRHHLALRLEPLRCLQPDGYTVSGS